MRSLLQQLTIYAVVLNVVVCSAQDIPEISSDNIHLRGSLTNSKLVFEQTGQGHVAFIGGSITQMNGYRPMLSAFLEQRFPKTLFRWKSTEREGIDDIISMWLESIKNDDLRDVSFLNTRSELEEILGPTAS